MEQTKLQSARNVAYEKMQRDEWEAMQPDLKRFRTTDEEIRSKAEENLSVRIGIEDGAWVAPDRKDFMVWAEWLARCGREGVRFDRWRYPHLGSN